MLKKYLFCFCTSLFLYNLISPLIPLGCHSAFLLGVLHCGFVLIISNYIDWNF